MELNELVRSRINYICAAYDLTLNALCVKCDIPVSTLRHYMDGYRKEIKLRTILRICRGLGLTPNEFFGPEFIDNLENIKDL